MTYMIVRHFCKGDNEVIKTDLSLEEAQEWCSDPDTASKTCTTKEGMALTMNHGQWFDGYEEEQKEIRHVKQAIGGSEDCPNRGSHWWQGNPAIVSPNSQNALYCQTNPACYNNNRTRSWGTTQDKILNALVEAELISLEKTYRGIMPYTHSNRNQNRYTYTITKLGKVILKILNQGRTILFDEYGVIPGKNYFKQKWLTTSSIVLL